MFGPDFYPTPNSVAFQMIAKISKDAENILEPSAGKGDLAEAIRDFGKRDSYHGDRGRFKIDCIESNPELAHVLTGKEFPVVGYDWLTYEGVCYYDAIIMNPPFSNGDEHLLRAWEFMHDGEIVSLLNEETLLNPYTDSRKRLVQIIAANGHAEYLEDCFSTAQRKTDVRVVLVYLKKTAEDDRIEVWAKTSEEKRADADIGDSPEDRMLAIQDNLGNLEHYYNMANEHMLKSFAHMRRASLYMEAEKISMSSGSGGDGYGGIAAMALRNSNSARAEFARKHRRDAWMRVFELMEFHKWLDKKQREQLLRDVERDCNIPFTAENIKGTLENVMLQRKKLFEQSVANVFDELCRHHKDNGVSEGWKTNDNYKVNRKVIFPYGCQFDSQYFNKFELRYDGAIDVYNDLDRVLCVLDGTKFEECLTIGAALKYKFDKIGTKYHPGTGYSTGDNTVNSSYFRIKFWKKGTVHLEFKDVDLWERFNVTAAAGKKWLGENTNGKSEFPGRRPTYNNRPESWTAQT